MLDLEICAPDKMKTTVGIPADEVAGAVAYVANDDASGFDKGGGFGRDRCNNLSHIRPAEEQFACIGEPRPES